LNDRFYYDRRTGVLGMPIFKIPELLLESDKQPEKVNMPPERNNNA
jgi:hypothetical protein